MEKTGLTSSSETLCVIFNKGYEQDKSSIAVDYVPNLRKSSNFF